MFNVHACPIEDKIIEHKVTPVQGYTHDSSINHPPETLNSTQCSVFVEDEFGLPINRHFVILKCDLILNCYLSP